MMRDWADVQAQRFLDSLDVIDLDSEHTTDELAGLLRRTYAAAGIPPTFVYFSAMVIFAAGTCFGAMF